MQWRIKRASKAGHCFQIDVTDMMDRCQMGDALRDEEMQIISCYLDLAAGEGEGDNDEHGKEGEESSVFTQKTQLMVN